MRSLLFVPGDSPKKIDLAVSMIMGLDRAAFWQQQPVETPPSEDELLNSFW